MLTFEKTKCKRSFWYWCMYLSFSGQQKGKTGKIPNISKTINTINLEYINIKALKIDTRLLKHISD